MKRISFLSFFNAYLSITHAAPASSLRAESGATISEQCINAELRQSWLVADCLTGEDTTTRIQSAVFLPNKIENNDGSLDWQAGGEYRRSCSDCTVSSTGASLSCTCATAWGTGKPSYLNATMNLDEHISVYSGHLLSNLTGPPEIPASTSPYPVPSSLTYSFGGRTTCPDPANPNGTDWCSKQVHACTTTPNDRTSTSQSMWFEDGPLNCYVPVIYFPQYKYQFEALRWVGEGAWEVLGYADESCAGEVVERVGPEDAGVCKEFGGTKVRALTVRPAFNGDAR